MFIFIHKNVNVENMNYVKEGWSKIKNNIESIDELYTFDETKNLLLTDYFYKDYFGRARNRTMMKNNPKLYKSIYHYSEILENVLKKEGRDKGWYNFKYRMIFIVEKDGDVESLRCQCGYTYNWTTYCRKCPEPKKTWAGRTHSSKTKKKQRISTLNYLEETRGQLAPRYNIHSIPIIEKYGNDNDYNFQHAENGGEYYIKELGYFLDAYDRDKNVVLEIDETHHFNSNGELKARDLIRQREIENYLGCKFIRIKV